MSFDLTFTEEQQALVSMAREFARKEIIPVAGKLDEHGTFPTEILKKAWELGLMNVEIPEEHGGTVVCRSKPGKGTTFEVRIPAGAPRD